MTKMILPSECEKGTCDHAQHGIPCTLQERRCLSGECAHFSHGQYCPTALPAVQPPHRLTPPTEVQRASAEATADAPDREPCGESGCICYGVGAEHVDCACGCDCPRCDDCQQGEEYCQC